MSLFSIVKTVMDSNGWPAPVTGVVASQDQNMRQSFALANKVLKNVSFRKDWPQIAKLVELDLVAGQSEYDVPTDLHHIISPSAFDIDQYQRVRGALTPMQVCRVLSNGAPQFLTSFYINHIANKIKVSPVPTSPFRVMYAYVTDLIVKDAGGNYKREFSQDDDVSLVDEDVIELGVSWRWRQKKGLDYTTEIAEFNTVLNQRFAQYLALGEIPVGCPPQGDAPLTNGYIGTGPIGV